MTMKNLDELYVQLGGFGLFQLVVIVGQYSSYMVFGFSMLQMTFAGLIPDWNCIAEGSEPSSSHSPSDFGNDSLYMVAYDTTRSLNMSKTPGLSAIIGGYGENHTLNVCSINGTECNEFRFQGSSVTIITEWNLICSLKWIKQIVTSVQMCGVLVGAVASGQLGDRIGRKKVFYAFVLEHTIVNFIAGFSSSWQMFAVCRFFIGIGLGGHLVVIFPYSLEFFPLKWRPILACFPFFALGIALFAGMALLLDNWAYLHFFIATCNLPYVFGWFYFPDSPRWLAVHGRLDEAEQAIEKVARLNRKPMPPTTSALLEAVAREEREIRESGNTYTYLDIFRGLKIAKISLVISYMWIALNIAYYGLSFGVASLDGNLYLNIFLMAVLEIPVQFTTIYTNAKYGRRPSAIFFFCIATISSAVCLITTVAASGSTGGILINIFALIAKMLIGAAWCVIILWGVELYPTVTRNLGYGLANTAARVGGILAPFIINLDHMIVPSYAIMTGLLFVCTMLSIILPETKGTSLPDSMVSQAVIIGEDSSDDNPKTQETKLPLSC